MQPPFPSFTPTWHNDTYPAIDPTKKEHSQAGKTVVITGAGSGTGRQTALAFATAGAKHLVLIGRTESDLIETQKLLHSTTTSAVFPASVSERKALKELRRRLVVGTYSSWELHTTLNRHPQLNKIFRTGSWHMNTQTNVKSIMIAAQAFFPTAAPGAAVYAITAGALALPSVYTPNLSGYVSSKVAQVKVMEFLAAENPELFICTVHPGLLDTKIFKSSTGDAKTLPMDTYDLEAHFMVWLTQSKNKFLQGRMVWANWDVDELSAQSEKISTSTLLTIGYGGWPFA